jgi:hypothetical protein
MVLVLGATNLSIAACDEFARAMFGTEGVCYDERCAAPDAFDTRDFCLATRAQRGRHLFEDPGSENGTFRTATLRAISRCEQSRRS